ncbi:hypothetical protein [uncultured Kriegella sp.]|uniref:hypothetical protein n=1 Tax=uncultured Kriegella sp. TaxID=1798910 RepID=UPI0030DB9D9E
MAIRFLIRLYFLSDDWPMNGRIHIRRKQGNKKEYLEPSRCDWIGGGNRKIEAINSRIPVM